MRSPSNYALRLPASLKKAAEQVARQDGATLNQFIVTAVAEKLSAQNTADYFRRRAARGDLSALDEIYPGRAERRRRKAISCRQSRPSSPGRKNERRSRRHVSHARQPNGVIRCANSNERSAV